jgi:hypothetical protein
MENKKTLQTGSSDFKRIVENNHYFVDKTALIYDFFTGPSYISLMPRPKRFGKTLNLSMIEHFFDVSKKDSAKLFSEFEIATKKEFCEAHQNKYPVINISLKDVKETSWENCLERFKKTISGLYNKHRYLLKSEKIENYEKQLIENVISRKADETDFKSSLEDLCRYLKQHFDKDVIILVDEYDAPIISGFKNTPKPIKNKKGEPTYYENVINFMQTFMGSAFKGNNDLVKGLITGVMRVGRESIFSDWNNFDVFGITSTYFADKFGFTQSETEKILTYFELQDSIDDVEKWYNGYKFGNVDKIYNPWSIINFISKESDGFRAYWVNTSDDSIIKERITEPNVKEAIQELICKNTIIRTIKENFVFPDFENDSELLWSILFYSGFLTQTKQISLNRYELKIPNYELKFVFENIILEWLQTSYKFNQDLLITTANYLIINNIPDFENGFKQIIGDSISYFDTAKDAEQIYHVYTLGLLAILSDDYLIKSNRESGEGRYDIVLIPRNQANNGVVIEIKRIDGQGENEEYNAFKKRINHEIESARQQIERKKYYKELLSHKIALDKIIRIPIVFAGKEPYITKLEE